MKSPVTKNLSVTKSKGGFTIVESLIAISILLVAIVGPISIVSQSIQTSNVAKDQITAFYLAQEAIEYIRNIRDKNILNVPNSANWLSGLEGCKDGKVCRIDVINDAVNSCGSDPNGACLPFNLVAGANNLKTYGYGSGQNSTPTTFVRSVSIDETIPNLEAAITVTMTWKTGSIPRNFTIRSRVFNWSGF